MGIMKIVPREIKQEILAKVKTGGRVMELAKQYGISDKTIYYWLRQNAGEEIVSVVKYNKLRRENEELKKLLGEVTLKLSLGEKN
jgi:transposase-like protein